MNNTVIGQGYTIPVSSIVEQIWADGHPDNMERRTTEDR